MPSSETGCVAIDPSNASAEYGRRTSRGIPRAAAAIAHRSNSIGLSSDGFRDQQIMGSR